MVGGGDYSSVAESRVARQHHFMLLAKVPVARRIKTVSSRRPGAVKAQRPNPNRGNLAWAVLYLQFLLVALICDLKVR